MAANLCETTDDWGTTLYCIYPYAWAAFGVALAMGISIIGAAW